MTGLPRFSGGGGQFVMPAQAGIQWIGDFEKLTTETQRGTEGWSK